MGNRGARHGRRSPAKFEPIDSDDLEYRLEWVRFKDSVKAGDFIDHDGFGHFATIDRVSDVVVLPSHLEKHSFKRPTWATHVIWYSK